MHKTTKVSKINRYRYAVSLLIAFSFVGSILCLSDLDFMGFLLISIVLIPFEIP